MKYLINATTTKKTFFPIIFLVKIENRQDIAYNLSNFFKSIGPTLSVSIPNHKYNSTKTYLIEKMHSHFISKYLNKKCSAFNKQIETKT